jgi:hypothetical protein
VLKHQHHIKFFRQKIATLKVLCGKAKFHVAKTCLVKHLVSFNESVAMNIPKLEGRMLG